MPALPAALVRHHERLDEIGQILAKYGFAGWVQRGSALVSARVVKGLVDRFVDPGIVAMSDGERLRRALTELGTTWIKFGQMLSLRPDVVGDDVAAELTRLQATVAADPPGIAQALVEHELGAAVSDLFGSFEPEPMASGSVAQIHRATLHDGTALVVKVLHDGVERGVLEDLELMDAIATFLEREDPGLAQLRPTVIVGEFSQMLHDAIDLSQELRNLQRFALNFADEADITIPTPYPEYSRRRVLTMSLISGAPFTDRASVEATGWHVETLVRRTADMYLEMIFRDSLYHADPQPGNLLLPDGTHIAVLDFGDVGRISGMRKRQLEDLVIAAGTHDLDGFIDAIVEITTPPPTVDMDRLRSQIDMWLNRHLLIGVGHLDMTTIIKTGMQLLHDNGLVLPADLSLLFRVLLQLQGLGRVLNTEVRVTELLEPYVEKLLAERFQPRRLARHASRTVRGWDRLATSLPGDIEEIIHQIRAGQFGFDFRVHDPDGVVDHLVDGLVAAASVVASAQLVSRRTGPTVGPISLPGVIAGGVGVLIWQRLVRRRREHKTWVSRARELAQLRGQGARS
ncbi:MAG TPA: AarF/UbiB family protein [Acidimicrobiales bacterium]|nr:AarF/UbiB family protein [Acidimicrobiales bacterium]